MMHASQTIRLRPPAGPPPYTMRMHRDALPEPTVRLERPTCLNCDVVLSGKFCHHCGQAAKTPKRITLGAILHDLPHSILHLEHALPRTIVALLRRPGHTIRDYLGGKRVGIYSPFALLFLVSGLVGLATLTLQLKGALVVKTDGTDLGIKIAKVMMQYHAWVQLLLVPLLAIGPTLVLRRRTGLRYGEQIVAMAMASAGSAVLQLMILPVKALAVKLAWRSGVTSAVEMVTTVYMLWTYAQLQVDGKTSAVRRWANALAAMLTSVVILCALVVAGIVIGVLVYLFAKSRHLV